MKIAIHHTPGSFSDRWIAYCEEKIIDYKKVNCYSTDIIKQLEDCDALMWHHSQSNYKDILFSKQLHFAIEQSGKKIFPNYKTFWHFDDKIAQKYLFEAIRAPFVRSYIFYSEADALQWVENTTFPKVFKLRGGAGSANVRLVSSPTQARGIVKKAFSRGFRQIDSIGQLKERLRKYREGKGNVYNILKGLGRLVLLPKISKMHGNEKGYVLFQNYIPNNSFDIRVIVIAEKAFAIKRLVRKNDFRASGSGNILYEKKEIDERCVKIAFETTEILQTQCAAYDFVFDQDNQPKLLEISYGFVDKVYDQCPGYWDKTMKWHIGTFNPYGWMVELLC